MKYNKKAVVAIQDFKYCRCNHDSSLHDKNGCHGEILNFVCQRVGHDRFTGDEHATKCIVRLPCPCKFTGATVKKTAEQIVAERGE
jgi:hypothetical protein